MKRFLVLTLTVTTLLVAAPNHPGPQLQNARVEVVRVLRDVLVVDLLEEREVFSGAVWARSGRLVVLVPGTNAAVGDRYDVWAREDGTREIDASPLKAYRVTKAQRQEPTTGRKAAR